MVAIFSFKGGLGQILGDTKRINKNINNTKTKLDYGY